MTPRLFRFISWIPLATVIAIEIYTRGFDGWGRWASAPLFLLPVILSGFLVPIGVRMCRNESEGGVPIRPTVLATALAGMPALWFVARALFA